MIHLQQFPCFLPYVHGAYETAMELFSGRTDAFMLNGHESDDAKGIAKKVIAGKLHEVIIALEFMAKTRGIVDLVNEIVDYQKRLEASEEYNA